MLVVTIGTIIAVNLMWNATLDLRRTESALAADQGLLYMQGAEAWAADILRQDQVDSPNSDNLSEAWATRAAAPARRRRHDRRQARGPAGALQSEQPDQTRRHAERPCAAAVRAAAESCSISIPGSRAPSSTGSIPDTEVRFPTGGEDVTYAGADPPYRTANSMITSPSELMAVTGSTRTPTGSSRPTSRRCRSERSST